MSDYPEHERMAAVRDQSQIAGELLEWLQYDGVVLARWELTKPCTHGEGPIIDDDPMYDESGKKWRCEGGTMVGHPESTQPGEHRGQCKVCEGTGRVERIEPRLVPTGETIEKVLARKFGIDLDKIDAEKQAMLAELRKVASR